MMLLISLCLVSSKLTVDAAGPYILSGYRKPSPLEIGTINSYLSSIYFDTQEDCISQMCRPQPRSPLLKCPNRSQSTPPSAMDNLNQLQGFIGGQSYIIRDDQNNVIGLTTDQNDLEGGNNMQGMEGMYPVPPTTPQKPTYINTDVCCQTIDKYFINDTMKDITGVSRTLAQMQHTGSYQILRHGICGPKGVCPGTCEQEYITMQLAIYPTDPGQLVTYRWFAIPGYCACKVRMS